MSDAAQVAQARVSAAGAIDSAAAGGAGTPDIAGTADTAERECVEVVVRYWAAARAATGVDSERLIGRTVGEVLDTAVEGHPGLFPVCRVATFLLDGRSAARESTLAPGATLEVLPPFAGG